MMLAMSCGGPPPTAKKTVARQPDPPAITQFYASPEVIAPGGRALLCYGVENTTKVAINPPIEQLSPALSRCIEARPKATTTYTLTAESANGTSQKTQVVRIDPNAKPDQPQRPPTSIIEFVSVSATSIQRGQPVFICYSLKGAASIALDPPVSPLTSLTKGCFSPQLTQTTTFKITAKSASGATDSESVTIKVQ
jgi:hypothetical protein